MPHSRSRSRSRSGSRRRGNRSRSRSHSRHHDRRRRSRSRSHGKGHRDRGHGSHRHHNHRRSGSHSRRHRHHRSRSTSGSYSRSRSRSGSRDRSGRHHERPFSRRDGAPASRTVAIFGMATATDEEALRIAFAEFGEIAEVQIVRDSHSGRSRGFGFVHFRSVDDAKTAKDRMHNVTLDGRPIRTDFSFSDSRHVRARRPAERENGDGH